MTKAPDKKHILLVDDDRYLTQILTMTLRQEGYEVTAANAGSEGLRIAKEKNFDCIVLDLHMPKVDGFTICKQLRAEGVMSPILILSGVTDKLNIVQVLKLGADDYLTKPFDGEELTARLHSLIRRNTRAFQTNQLQRGGITLQLEERRVYKGSQSVTLTPIEATLLSRLIHYAPNPVSRQTLLKEVWGISDNHTSNRLDAYIKRLRQKLAKLTSTQLIHTIHASGYRFSD